MNRLITISLTVAVTLALVWLAAVAVAWSGTVNVAATADYVPGARWFFSTTSDRSIARHAEEAVERGEIVPPGEVTQEMLDLGASHYRSMCVVCHGAPGVDRGEIGQGLKPRPPELSHVAREMSRAEIYWVLQHGIRHTGMPAFGATHGAEELWALTTFVERLDDMSPEAYRQATATSSGSAGAGGGAEAAAGGDDHASHEH